MYVCITEGDMRHFTMNIDDGLLQAAKLRALQTKRTVSDIVRDLLAKEVGWSGETRSAPIDDGKAFPVLHAYSEGRIPRRRAMESLGLEPDQYSAFVDAMTRLSVPWPAVDREQVEREADIVVQAIEAAHDED
jgi:plasmid stability protein